MSDVPSPTFIEWVDYCFTRGNVGSAGVNDNDVDQLSRFGIIDAPRLTEYMVRLFENPEFVVKRYTDDQIGDGVSFLFGSDSEYFKCVQEDSVDTALQVRCIASVECMYVRLFDRVCCSRGSEPDREHDDRVDSAVFMIWDMDCIEVAAMYPDKVSMLVEPCLTVLESVLRNCRTSTCRQSSLHGLGHLYSHYKDYSKDMHNPLALRVRRAIDSFLQRQDVPEWLREYALQAREGYVL